MHIRNLFIALSLIFFVSDIQAQAIYEQDVKSDIGSAVIYLNGAEISRSEAVNLRSGQNRLVFKGLSHQINSKSIRVTTADNVDLLGITFRTTYLADKTELPRIKKLKDSLEYITLKTQALTDERDAYNTEKSMLLKNMSIGGTDNGVSVAELQKASDFYRARIQEINKRMSEINRVINKLNIEKGKYSRELNELNAQLNYPSGEVVILVSSDVSTRRTVELKYLVANCGWSPAYDIRAEDTDEPVDLVYRAKVFNNTGIDWENLKMKLSTADPNLSITQPVLNPWYLKFQSYARNNRSKSYPSGGMVPQANEGYTQNMIMDTESDDFGAVNETTLNNNIATAELPDLNAEFDIKQRYSIPSDDKPYLVEIQEHKLPADYKHFAVTKLDKDVFLLARITGWEDLNLIDGPVNVYYSGTYLGEAFINTRNVKDTLNFSLGRDSKVLVTRSKLKDFSSRQFIGNKQKEVHTYELVAKNNRKTVVDIDILDQLPISQSDEIEVKALEISGAELHADKGELKWNFKLQPGESKKIRLSFEIKYPKGKDIQIQQRKQRQVRYF